MMMRPSELPKPFRRALIHGYSTVITETGQLSRASAAASSADSGTGSAQTSARPSSAIRNTSGQVDAHSPQEIQSSLSIIAFIC